MKFVPLVLCLALATPLAAALPPVVIVPGAPATELYDPVDGARIWPSTKLMFARWGSDRMLLPLNDPESARARTPDVIRKVRAFGLGIPFDVYGPLEARLRELGYRRGDWAKPGAGAEYYLWPYDWRQSVENSGRLLFRELSGLQARRGDGERFVMIGHSLGGIVIRWALMYGDTPLGRDGPLPAPGWPGAALMREIRMAAVPNEGSFAALQYLDEGSVFFHGWGAFPPHVTFTFPSVFDLLPVRHDPLIGPDGAPRADDLEDPATWERLSISVFSPARLRGYTRAEARAHLAGELKRRARLQAALAQDGADSPAIPVHLAGGDCERVLRSAMISGPPGRERLDYGSRGPRAQRERLAPLLFEAGDEMVSRRSLLAQDAPPGLGGMRVASTRLGCSSHQRLPGLPAFTDPLGASLRTLALATRPELAPIDPGAAAGALR